MIWNAVTNFKVFPRLAKSVQSTHQRISLNGLFDDVCDFQVPRDSSDRPAVTRACVRAAMHAAGSHSSNTTVQETKFFVQSIFISIGALMMGHILLSYH